MPLAVLVAVDDADRPIGFVELFIRSYAEDCETDRVAYLEGRDVGRSIVAGVLAPR